jgi:UDP-N-acetylmuramoyl-L-alanyl-D-glutamate--2,6-diaminopimelate ligase
MIAGVDSAPAEQRAALFEQGDRRAAIEQAIALAGPGDTVLIAGKGHEAGQEVDGVLTPFDDVTVARAALAGQGHRAAEGFSDEQPGSPVAGGAEAGVRL